MKKLFIICMVGISLLVVPKDGPSKADTMPKSINRYEMIKHEILVDRFFEEYRTLQRRITITNKKLK